jgi:hypothetical protein
MTNDWFQRLILSGALLLLPATVLAQSVSTGSITGVVRDTSGAVLPGVTVEAGSPALIEKVRSAVSDSSGVYRITDLRPGTYSVTFTLAGFSTLRRAQVELTTGFTATVNGDLAVGNLAETITVSGAAPTVDTTNTSQQSVFSRDVTENLPLGSGIKNYAALVPGATYAAGGSAQDVGGSKGEYSQNFLIHGGRGGDFQQLRDGMFYGTLVAAGNWMTSLNPATVAETTVQTSSGGAELESGGVLVNVVPRDGGNVFSGTFNANGTRPGLQSDNFNDELKARGLTSGGPTVRARYDVGGGIGGPLQRDRVWFFGSARSWRTSSTYPGNFFNKTPGTLFYTADSSRPAYDNSYYKEVRGRVTWQPTSKDKVNVSFGNEWNCDCASTIALGNTSPESFAGYATNPSWQAQVTWSRPVTSRLLLEAGSVVLSGRLDSTLFGAGGEAGGSVDDPFVLDSSRNYGYGGVRALGLNGGLGFQLFGQTNERFSVSYVTGSHAFKTGVQYLHGWGSTDYGFPASRRDTTYIFNGRTPTFLTYYAAPVKTATRQEKVAFFAQDQWTINRLTLNLGLRFDYLKGSVPALDIPAGTWVPERHFGEVTDIPNWKDWTPRVGAVYNLFGNGKTAIKGFLGRYVVFESIIGITAQNGPANRLSNTATRSWSDNGDYIPQESELGPLSDVNFGKVVATTTYSPDLLTGNRPYNWQGSVQVQQDLGGGLGLNVGYFRTWYGNQRVTNNQAVSPSDFSSYCITSPVNSLLPDGGGKQVCGFYDVSRAKFGQSNPLVDLASKYGNPAEVFNGLDVSMTARLGAGRYVQAGLSTGSTMTDTCYVNDQPQLLPEGGSNSNPRTADYCKVNTPWSGSTQFKAAVVLPLWWDLQASANYQNIAGISTAANALISNAAIVPTLGRDLSACRPGTSGAACTSTVTANIVLNNTYYLEPRLQQLDVRLSRTFRLAGGARIQPQVDFFNILNSSPILGITTRLGPAFNVPNNVLDPRLVKFGVNMTF